MPSGWADVIFEMQGGSGNADLYASFGSTPTLSSSDCADTTGNNDAVCEFSAQTGRYNVLIHGSSSFSNAELIGLYE